MAYDDFFSNGGPFHYKNFEGYFYFPLTPRLYTHFYRTDDFEDIKLVAYYGLEDAMKLIDRKEKLEMI